MLNNVHRNLRQDVNTYFFFTIDTSKILPSSVKDATTVFIMSKIYVMERM